MSRRSRSVSCTGSSPIARKPARIPTTIYGTEVLLKSCRVELKHHVPVRLRMHQLTYGRSRKLLALHFPRQRVLVRSLWTTQIARLLGPRPHGANVLLWPSVGLQGREALSLRGVSHH